MDWKEVRRNRKKILVVVVSGVLVVLVLGLGLGLGLELQRCRETGPAPSPSSSCWGRCSSIGSAPGCRCDSECNETRSCCHDYHDLCVQPGLTWQCSVIRCGEPRGPKALCSCSSDCLTHRDCCTNYRLTCTGDSRWEDEPCDNLEEPTCPPSFQVQPVLLVSLDGFRAEYLQTWNDLLPVLNKIRTCGTSASYMQASFPTKTFPNHYTIVTGLYPESSGLVDNVMYDPTLNASFSLSSPERLNPDWYLGTPIWNTVRYEGLKSGTFFWPGSDVKVNGTFPHLYRPYDGGVPFQQRVFSLLQWLQLPQDQRPDFFTLYLEEPDKAGHSHGPVSGGLISSLQEVDDIIGQLMNGLKQLRLHRCLNIILLADHGMEEISCNRKWVLEDFLSDVSDLVVIEGPFSRIRTRNPAGMDSAALVANLTCREEDQKVRAFLKADLPKRLHFANSRRIEDVNILVEPRWQLERSRGSLRFCAGGTHGYDNDADSMHAMFLSIGPKFLSRTEVEPFSNIELYNLMCDLLQIPPAENNGTRGSLNHLLRKPFFSPAHPMEQSSPASCPLLSLDPENPLGCSCPALTGNSINSRLNLSEAEVSAVERKHLPLGRPRLLVPGHAYCLLHHQGFVSAFSSHTHMPLWTAFSMERPVDLDPLPPAMPGCLRADPRVPAALSQRCDLYPEDGSVVPGFLYPPGLNSSQEEHFDGLLVTNIVPMIPQFKRLWDYLSVSLLKRFSSLSNGVHVVVGPVFDSDADGRSDALDRRQQLVPGSNLSVPTHYFLLLTSCRNSSQSLSSCQDLDTASFLLPHGSAHKHNCKAAAEPSDWLEEVMWFHQARVRDVEWITGLDFYQDSPRPITELLRLKTRPTAAIPRKDLPLPV